MAFERKRFCFNLNCKVTEDEYKDESNFIKGTYEWYLSKGEKTKFNICSNCIIADFCSKTCQEQAQFLIKYDVFGLHTLSYTGCPIDMLTT